MAKKNALGRGLGALIEENDTVRERTHEVAPTNEIQLDTIIENPFQPRKHFDEDSLAELASSIKEIGVIQPITVRETEEGKYQLIAGERRYRAAKIAGLEVIPAYIRSADDQGMLEMALVENIQREDLDAVEVAIGYQRLIEECALTQENLSIRVGKKRTTITNYLRLLKLPAEIQLGIRERKISMGHARALINVEDPKKQLELFNKTINSDLSVREVEDLVRKEDELNSASAQDKSKKGSKDNQQEEYTQLQSHLSKFFNTSIEFKRNSKGSGKIVIPFSSDSELERIIGIFDKIKS